MDPLLSEDPSSGHDNLPLGTQVRSECLLNSALVHRVFPKCLQVFSSTVRYGHSFWYLSIGTAAMFVLFVIIGASIEGSSQKGMIASAFVLT